MFKQLLIPLDGSALAEEALGRAAAIARSSGAAIDIVRVHHASSRPEFLQHATDDSVSEAEHSYLERIATELASGAEEAVTHALLKGDPVNAVCARAIDRNADLIVLTSHGRTGLKRSWLGSVADGLIRNASVPVLLLRTQSRKEDRASSHAAFRRMLVLLDGSKDSEEILSAAAPLAAGDNSEVVLLRVIAHLPLANANTGLPFGMADIGIPSVLALVEDPQATEEARAAAAHELGLVAHRLADAGLTQIETHVRVSEDVPKCILDFVVEHDIDAIAMCSHGRGASRLLLGSVADNILRATDLPILLYRPVSKRVAVIEPQSASAEQPRSIPLVM